MGKEHLVCSTASQTSHHRLLNLLKKNLNATPIARINTLDRPASQGTLRSNDRPPAKRARRDSTQSSNLQRSHHFPTTRPDRQEITIQDGSVEDPFDIRSQSSTGKAPLAKAVVPEYRGVGVELVGKRSRARRKRRGASLVIAKDRDPFTASKSPDSPDVLAVDEIDELPRANIVSDVTSTQVNGRRGRPISHVEIPIKRAWTAYNTTEEIQESEDELAPIGSGSAGGKKKRRLTNFDSVDSRESKRNSLSKADITPTKFRSSRRSGSQKKLDTSFNLKGVVAGKQSWESSPDEEAALMFDEETRTFHFYVNEQPLSGSPYEIVLRTILKFTHSITNSPYVVILRQSSFSSPPQLVLHFETPEAAAKFVQCIPFKQGQGEEREPDRLEKIFWNAKMKAKNFEEKNDVIARSTQANVKTNPQNPWSRTHSGGWEDNAKPARGELRKADLTRPRRERLIDKLASSTSDRMSAPQDLTGAPEAHDEIRFTGRSLRSNTSTYTTRHRSPGINPFEEVKPDPWTQKNSGWQTQWKSSLVYPATGKNRATVDVDDIARLDEGEFLNDNLISFYLRYLQAELEQKRPEVLKKVHIFSSFFFEKLKSSARYEGVKSWTAKIDLFSYDYIVVPVNEHSHWYLAIICNVGEILPEAQYSEQDKVGCQDGEAGHMSTSKGSRSPAQTQPIPIDDDLSSPRTVRILDDVPSPTRLSPEQLKLRRLSGGSPSKANTKTPKIITLDSLDGSHSGTCKTLKTYLENEAQDKKGIELPFLPGGMKGKDVPRQDNFCDCGVFVLGYMEEFLKDPDEAARRLLEKEKLDWDIRPRELRTKIRDLLFSLQREQQVRSAEEQAKKRALKLQRKAAAAGVSDLSGNNSVSQSRAPSSGPPTCKPSSPDTAKTLARDSPLVENAPTKEHFKKSNTREGSAELHRGAESATVKGIFPTLEATNQTLPPHSPFKVKSLTTDSDSPASQPKSSSSEGSGEAFFSAPSSPAKSDRLRSEPPSLLINSVDGVPFVKKIPSSDSEGASTSRRLEKKKKKRNQRKHRTEFEPEHSIQPSVEKDEEEEIVDAPSSNHESVVSEAQPTVSAYFTLAPPSHERPSPRQSPQDEGIQQSIE